MIPPPTPFITHADKILEAARFRHVHDAWKLALFMIMPDHLHFIVHFPFISPESSIPAKNIGMKHVIADFKRWLSTTCGLRFQRDFFETRIRDSAHYTEKFAYICNNPVRKNLCKSARDWQYVIAFNRETGGELPHR